jgi:hypothetical protein
MARRKDDSFIEVFYGLFMVIPAWTCLPIAAAYGVITTLIVRFAPAHPLTKELGTIAPWACVAVGMLLSLTGFSVAGSTSRRDHSSWSRVTPTS